MPIGTTKNFVARSENPKKTMECYFCKKDHYSKECTEVTNPSERKATITAANRCYNCLRTGHSVKECRQTRKCYFCHGKHNTALCTSAKKNVSVNQTTTNISIMTVSANSKRKENKLSTKAQLLQEPQEKGPMCCYKLHGCMFMEKTKREELKQLSYSIEAAKGVISVRSSRINLC